MAKPTGWSINTAARPLIGKQYQELYQLSAERPRRRTRTPGAVTGPSSGVLSLLATIAAASSTADGSPLVQPTPPSFLCPFIERDDCHGNVDIPSDAGIAKKAPLTPARNHQRAVQVADKFQRGPDGKWRKANIYTLYGSTVCLVNCEPTGTHIDDNNVINSATPTTPPTPPPTSSMTPGPDDKFAAAMPTGWSPSTPFDKSRTTAILSISLVLAFFICAFMAGFIIWRRKKRRPSENDEEMKLRKKRSEDISEQEKLMKKEARMKQRFWVRASARWKANAQSSARRRKNRRKISAAHSMSTSLHDNAISRPQSRAPSRSSSLRPSPLPSARSSLSSDNRPNVSGHATQGPSIFPSDAPLPPAYPHSDSPPFDPLKHSHTYSRTDHDPSDPFSHDSHDTDEEHPEYTARIEDDPIPYDDSCHAAHVATDDKTILARMATMASAPPPTPDEGGSPALQTSAPVWDDERLEDITDVDYIGTAPPRISSPPPSLASTSRSPFPAPPPISKMAAPDFYDYPYSFEEDVSSLELGAGPSAPPFEEHLPSAPPLEDTEERPSAPPLMEEFLPSAPDWHWQDGEGGQDHDREGSLHQHSFQASSSTSIPATNNGVLPSYHA